MAFSKVFLSAFALLAATFLISAVYTPQAQSFQLEDADAAIEENFDNFDENAEENELLDSNNIEELDENEGIAFNEENAATLSEKLDEDEENENENETDNENENENEIDEENGESFLEENENENDAEEELDLSSLTEEDAAAVMDMLSDEEKAAFKEMLEQHKSGASVESDL